MQSLEKGIQVAQLIYENKKTEIRNIATSLSNDGTLQLLVKLNSQEKIHDYLSDKLELQRKNLYVAIITPKGGILSVHGGSETEAAYVEHLSQRVDLSQMLESYNRASTAFIERIPSDSDANDLLAITSVVAFSAESRLIGRSQNEQFAGAVLVQFLLNDDIEIITDVEKLLGVNAAIYQNYAPISALGDAHIPQEIYNTLIEGHSQYEAREKFRIGGELAQYTALHGLNNTPVGVLGISMAADRFVHMRRRAIYTLLGIMAGCLTGASVLGYVLARSILIPVNNLLNGVEKITSGDLSYELQIRSKDELGTVALAFNSMARQLKELIGTLEQRIEAATKELQSTLAYMSAIIDNMADGLLATDPHGSITRSNPALQNMLGLEEGDFVGKQCEEVFDEGLANLMELTGSGKEKYATAEINMANERIGKAVATAIYKDSTQAEELQDCIGSVLLTRDITREKEVDQMKTDFISTVSHELRTPLTSVLGFTKIIQKRLEKVIFPQLGDSTEKKTVRVVRQVRENLEIILTEGERLTSLINNVLDVAKMEAGKIDWKMGKLSVMEIIERATVATSSLFAKKGLAQIKDIPDDSPEIIGDKDRLIQVVINLISNAVKFTDEGSVTCRVERANNDLMVSVIDTGDGIAEADQPKVFEKFKQVGDTLTDKPQGTGLGLPICKQIIEHHGGRIWVESTLGEGSTFSFTIPILLESSNESRRTSRDTFIQHLEERENATMLPCHSRERKTILVVDDEASIRKLLRQELEPEGYLIREAQNGHEAIEKAWREQPCLIILDVLMPEMNGFEVATTLKSDPLSMDIPIIILSILAEQEMGCHCSVDSYLPKPVDTRQLLRNVADLVSYEPHKKKFLVVREESTDMNMLVDLLRKEHIAFEAAPSEMKELALKECPDIIITDTVIANTYDIINTLRSEKELQQTFLLILEEENTDGTSSS